MYNRTEAQIFTISFTFSFVTCYAFLKRIFTILLIHFILIFSQNAAFAQYKVQGTVYDSSGFYRIEAVTVMGTNGSITMTDTLGRYQISVNETDSIWFSYLGKPTPRYAVLDMADISRFDLAIRLNSNVMEEVRIRNRSYKLDSIQNRKDYAKIFNYKKVSLGSMTSIGPTGAGIDIHELIRLFQFRKNKAALKFQERLIEQEQQKFIDHRFNKGLVKRLTNLDSTQLEEFMRMYRPAYHFTANSTEYDFQLFIKTAGTQFRRIKSF